MQQVPAFIFIKGQARKAELHARLAVAEEGPGGGRLIGTKGRCRPRHALVEVIVAEPNAGDEVLVQFDGFGVGRPFHEGHASAGSGHVAFEAHRVFDVTDADGPDHGNVGFAHPEFVQPGRAELIVFQGRNESVLAGFPECTLGKGADAAEVFAVLADRRCRPKPRR